MIEHFSLKDVIHELGHVIDNVMSGKTRLGGSAYWGGGLSEEFAGDIGATGYENCLRSAQCSTYSPPKWNNQKSTYHLTGPSEDFCTIFYGCCFRTK